MPGFMFVRYVDPATGKTSWAKVVAENPSSSSMLIQFKDGTASWAPLSSVLVPTHVETDENGVRTHVFSDGAQIIEGDAELPGEVTRH